MPDQDRRSQAEVEKLELEIEKLRIETASAAKLKRYDLALKLLPSLSVIVTVLGFGFTVRQYQTDQRARQAAAEQQVTKERTERTERSRMETEAEQRNFMKPLLEKQQSLYFEASAAAAVIASSSNPGERNKAIDTFWTLYWGPLAMIESTDVSGAMKSFGLCLTQAKACDREQFRRRSLALASALEDSMLKTWNLKPDDFANRQFAYR